MTRTPIRGNKEGRKERDDSELFRIESFDLDYENAYIYIYERGSKNSGAWTGRNERDALCKTSLFRFP
jgi:hypothetical protein